MLKRTAVLFGAAFLLAAAVFPAQANFHNKIYVQLNPFYLAVRSQGKLHYNVPISVVLLLKKKADIKPLCILVFRVRNAIIEEFSTNHVTMTYKGLESSKSAYRLPAAINKAIRVKAVTEYRLFKGAISFGKGTSAGASIGCVRMLKLPIQNQKKRR